MKILKSPWNDLFFDLVGSCQNSIKITSPYVKQNIVANLIDNKAKDVNLSLITQFKLMNFYRGASDLDALEVILNKKGKVVNYQKLHSKIYIFDDNKAIVTSGNLTHGGLIKNYEYGVFFDDNSAVGEIVDDFANLSNHELSGIIGFSEINQAKEIISRIPKLQPIILPQIEPAREEIDVYSGGISSITSSLTGWKLEVFNYLLKLPSQTFSLQEVNNFVPELQKKFPNNHNIEAKIRQQLQVLRDIGLVMFMGNGIYKKLWI